MKKYIEDLHQALKSKNMTEDAIAEIIRDHEEMIEIAQNEGLAEADIALKFGDPLKVAEALADTSADCGLSQEDDQTLERIFDIVSESLSLDVHLVDDRITYRIGDEKDLVLRCRGKRSLEHYEISLKNDVFRLHAPSGKTLSFLSDNRVEFMLIIPKSVIIDSCAHKAVNGDSDFGQMSVKSLTIDTTNGDVNVQTIQADRMTIHSVNGDLSFKSSSFANLEISSVSGDVSMFETDVSDRFKWHAVSGDLTITSATCDQCLFDVVSGDVSGKEFYPNTLSFKSVSGDLDVSNLKPSSVETWKTKSLSGDISIR